MLVSRSTLGSALCALLAGSAALAGSAGGGGVSLGARALAPSSAAQVAPHADHSLPHDTIPDFCAAPTISSVASGAWSSPGTWSLGRRPEPGDVVDVSTGTVVTFDLVMSPPDMPAALKCVGVNGRLQFSTTAHTRLWSGDIMVHQGGEMIVGDAATPIPAGVTAEIVIANQALNGTVDPLRYGTGLIVMGKLVMHGAVKEPTFVRVSSELGAGGITIPVEQPLTGWQVGDRIVIPDTRHMRWFEWGNWTPPAPQWEERTIATISANGLSVTVNLPLTHSHLGARDVNGALSFLPHVGNLTRNVVVRSEVPIGSVGTRGHVMLTHRADIDIRYTQFRDLGRTTIDPLNPPNNNSNWVGRYALHIHHLMGPVTAPANGYQFTLIGNAIDGGNTTHRTKWGVVVHNSHYGLIKDNVAYNYAGSLFMFEDGSESFNVVDHNFALRSTGTGNREALGTEGGGFWFRGPNNRLRNNVAANLWGDNPEAAYGFKYFMRVLGNVKVPAFQGADTSVAGQFLTKNGNNLPILEFDNNEVYGAAQGMTYWWVNSEDPTPMANAEETVIRNLKIWHVFNVGVYHYPSKKVTFEGLTIRGSGEGFNSAACCGSGWFGNDYPGGQIVIRNSDIQGMWTGISLSSFSTDVNTIENTFLSNIVNVDVPSLRSVNGGAGIPARTTVLRNVRFQARPGAGLTALRMSWNADGSSQYNTTQSDKTFVFQHNGVLGDDLQVFYSVQATQAVAGGLAPCTSTRTGIQGLSCRFFEAFTDPTLTAGSSAIRRIHIEELRTRTNAVRTRRGLGAFAWTDPTLASTSTPIRAAHITELRTAIEQAYAVDGRALPTFTDPLLGAGTTMKAAHVTELRAAILAIE
jgi:hypothetical protein